MEELCKIFHNAIRSVDPSVLIKSCLSLENSAMSIHSLQDKFSSEFCIENSKIYVLAFGKASCTMTSAVQDLLGEKIEAGIVIAPYISRNDDRKSAKNFQYFWGAEDNLPDENAFAGAKAAVELAASLNQNDILLVLISGGGSSLFPYPIDGFSLAEKIRIIRELSNKGATINELNTVRKRLSLVKGGGLAELCRCTVISLILSDVIGDPLDVIASGPTVPNKDPPDAAIEVLSKYQIQFSSDVKKILENERNYPKKFDRTTNFLIGSNWHALKAIKLDVLQRHMIPVVISRSVEGEARNIGKAFCHLMLGLVKLQNTCDFRSTELLSVLLEEELGVSASFTCTLSKNFRISSVEQRCLVIIAGGETTVTVRGKGKGGRNQEVGLAFLIETAKEMASSPILFERFEATLLSSGTDGQDGPTDVAGVVVDTDIAKKINIEEAERALEENDSYTFFTNLEGGRCFVKTGPTGTNIMDLMMLMIRPTGKYVPCPSPRQSPLTI